MKIRPLILSAALVFPLAVVPVTAMGQNTPHDNMMPSGQSPQISVQAQHFFNTIASEDASEISLAHLALKKSDNSQVKNYAKSKILAADPSMKHKAIQLAKRNHASVPGFPTSTDKAEYYYLSKLSGKSFDKAYMDYEDAKQRADLIMVKNEAAGAKNPHLKAYAQKEETPVRQAAQSAKQIAQSLGA